VTSFEELQEKYNTLEKMLSNENRSLYDRITVLSLCRRMKDLCEEIFDELCVVIDLELPLMIQVAEELDRKHRPRQSQEEERFV
jgi:hypothetical protein